MDIEVVSSDSNNLIATLYAQPLLIDRIKEAQKGDADLVMIMEGSTNCLYPKFGMHDDGSLRYGNRVCVPSNVELKEEILSDAHKSRFSIHLGGTKMYRDLLKHFWWKGMKRDVANFVARCITCQQVKFEHQRNGGTL